MTDKIIIKIKQSSKSRTHYIIVPAEMVTDSQYPFKNGDEVEIDIISKKEGLVIKKIVENKEDNPKEI